MIATIQFYEASRSTARFYTSVERDAILGVHANHHGWHMIDHAAARPGSGRGHALRQMVFPSLAAAADRHGITIFTTVVNQQNRSALHQGPSRIDRRRPRTTRQATTGPQTTDTGISIDLDAGVDASLDALIPA